MRKIILLLIMLIPVISLGQSKNQNFVKKRMYNAPSTGQISQNDTVVNVTYLDGLGRPFQSIAAKAGGNGQDIVMPVYYSVYGMQTKQYLSYADPAQASTSSSLNLRDKTPLLNAQKNYYLSNYPQDVSGSGPTFGEVKYEASPLKRPIEKTSPGNIWASGSKTIRLEYGTNSTITDPVYDFKVRFANNETDKPEIYLSGGLRNSQIYAAGTLYMTIVKDENWLSTDLNNKTTQEYKDKEGKLILKRQFNEGVKHDTYYVYDRFDNLSFVISPEAFSQPGFITSSVVDFNTTFTIDQLILEKYSYSYKYDSRNRLIEKKIPGKGYEYTVYDKLDRPVFVQNANQRDNNGNSLKWLFYKYDKYNRVVYAGQYTSSSNRTVLQSTVDMATLLSESKTPALTFTLNGQQVYYTNNVFPTTAIELFTVNYYDNYTFSRPGIVVPVSTDYHTLTTSLNGLPTGSSVRVLDSGTTSWITTVRGYDSKGRLIWTKNNNPYFTTNNTIQLKLDFSGKVVETKTGHIRAGSYPQSVSITDNFTYGYGERQTIHTQKIDNAPVAQIISSKKYNERGQLIQKGIGGLNDGAGVTQTIDYSYNIRGWLTQINNPDNLGNDTFSERIAYNLPTVLGTPLYNGNISQVSWKTASDNNQRVYNYTFDDLSRLKTAEFVNLSNSAQNGSFDLNSISYDKNGNITSLQRAGNKMADAAQENMDNLVYTYDGNKLQRVQENGLLTSGFKGTSPSNTAVQYNYDTNGNLTSDINKNISSIEYNHLNLPVKVNFTSGKYVQYVYDAEGYKLKKVYFDGSVSTITEYNDGFIYLKSGAGANTLQHIRNKEGYAFKNSSGTFSYAYQHKDHLGNVRQTYTDLNNDRSITANEIIEEVNYDPFGLKHEGYNVLSLSIGNSLAQKLRYNTKELQDENDLGWYDYGARNYSPEIGRWMSADPFAEAYYSTSPYVYAVNNPVYFIDPDGRSISGGPGDGDPYTWNLGDLPELVIGADAPVYNVITNYVILQSDYYWSYFSMGNGGGSGGGGGGAPGKREEEKTLLRKLSDYWNSPTVRAIIPDKFSLSVSASITDVVGISGELSITWITRGNDASIAPYATATTGVQAGLDAGADALIGASVGWYNTSDMRSLAPGIASEGLTGYSAYGSADAGFGLGGSVTGSVGFNGNPLNGEISWYTVGGSAGLSIGGGATVGGSYTVPINF